PGSHLDALRGSRMLRSRTNFLLAVLVALGLSACSGHGGGSGFFSAPSTQSPTQPTQPTPRRTPPTQPPTSTAQIFTRQFVADAALIKTTDVAAGNNWFVERAFPSLRFVRPVYVTHAGDGSGRLFVCELRGRIWALSPASSTAAVTTSLFLDITSQ